MTLGKFLCMINIHDFVPIRRAKIGYLGQDHELFEERKCKHCSVTTTLCECGIHDCYPFDEVVPNKYYLVDIDTPLYSMWGSRSRK